VDAIISHGCFLRECSVQHSIVGIRSRLESGVELQVYIFYFSALVTFFVSLFYTYIGDAH
jgi:ADP-glucose pyrophosphorylase